jgi:ribonuclease T
MVRKLNIGNNNMTHSIAERFRRFLPVVVDLETAGLNSETDAILEIAAIILTMDANGKIIPQEQYACHVLPFKGANLDQEALEFNGIDPYHPFRFAVDEATALSQILLPIERAVKDQGCQRAVLVGHNPNFDLSFLKAAIKRCNYKPDPFHAFTTFDTATLAALALKHTVLAVAAQAAGLAFDNQQAHSAIYDVTKTAELFCYIVNKWDAKESEK